MSLFGLGKLLGCICLSATLIVAIGGCADSTVPGDDEIEKLSPEYDPSDNPNMGDDKAVGDP